MSTPRKFRKKPVTIEAMQWDGTDECAVWITAWVLNNEGVASYQCADACDGTANTHHLVIETLEGGMLANAGDWVIRGVAGEFYPCKPEIFAATYEEQDA